MATPLVADLLDGVPAMQRMLVMVQREVGERLAAAPGDDAYGAVSVKVAYWATADVVGRVPPTVFLPRPKVESALVAITRRPQPAVGPTSTATRLFALVRAGLRPAAQDAAPVARRAWSTPSDFEAAGIRPDARAEELGVADWGRLAAVVQAP